MLCYSQIIVKILFGDIFSNKTQFYIRLTNNEWDFNWEECKNGRPYFTILTTIDNQYSITVDDVLLPNTSESTFWFSFLIQKYNLCKIDRERISFKLGGMKPEGWSTLFYSSLYNHSLIILVQLFTCTCTKLYLYWYRIHPTYISLPLIIRM